MGKDLLSSKRFIHFISFFLFVCFDSSLLCCLNENGTLHFTEHFAFVFVTSEIPVSLNHSVELVFKLQWFRNYGKWCLLKAA